MYTFITRNVLGGSCYCLYASECTEQISINGYSIYMIIGWGPEFLFNFIFKDIKCQEKK